MSCWFYTLETSTADVGKFPGFCAACRDASVLCDTGAVCCGVSYFIQTFSAYR